MEDISRGRVCLINLVMNLSHGCDRCFDRAHAQIDGVMGSNFSCWKFRQSSLLSHDGWSTVSCSVESSHSLGNAICPCAGDGNDFIEIQVQVTEVGANNIPVGLFANQLQSDEVHKNGLQILGQCQRSSETVLSVLGIRGLCPMWFRLTFGHRERFSHDCPPYINVAICRMMTFFVFRFLCVSHVVRPREMFGCAIKAHAVLLRLVLLLPP